ncbi:MAG: type II secretion system F family protein, partial [Candidatus Didemnitutus sp.]|nr:type II secretion system F family protein [Candidatus Didemnitutus sp.]
GVLLKAGMPLLRGLEVLSRQERNRAFQQIMEALADDIRSGSSLSEALARHPLVFDRLYVNMVKAGEAGGVLEVVLDRVAKFQEKSLQLRGKIKAAMMYPLVVMAVAVLILAGLLVFVVPKFQQIFADLLKGAPLPPLTQAVLVASDAVRQHYLVVLAVLIGGWIGFHLFRRSPSGSRWVDGWLIRLPLFGELLMKSLVARFTRTLGTLLASGVPILQAITITRDTTGNVRVADALEVVHDRVKAGEPVARPLERTQVFPAMVTSMIDVGEHTGQLPEMLSKVADIYEDEVDTAVAGLSSLIEPVLIVLLAGVVGTIVVALFLPIVRIVQLLT